MTLPQESPCAPDIEVRYSDDSLPILLLRARALMVDRFRKVFRNHEISEQQFRVLRALHTEQLVDVTALAARTDLLYPSLSRILRDMAARGLVTRQVGSDDARQTLASLTQQGRDLLGRTMIDVQLVHVELNGEIGDERVADLAQSLQFVIGVLDSDR